MGCLVEKVALVTGGCSGIGEGIALGFLNAGARVVAVDRRPPSGALERALADGALAYLSADLCDAAQTAQAIDEGAARFGWLDILVNNAGAAGPATPVADMDVDGWDAAFALLVRAPMIGIKHAAPHMRIRGGGSIINISSAAGLRTVLMAGPAYATAKAAVQKLTTSAAVELAADLIRVNTIVPGGILTSISAPSLGATWEEVQPYLPELETIYRNGQPLPVAGLPRHIADAALFLASDQSAFVTGAELVVDGGLTLTPGSRPKGAQMAALAERIARERATT